MVQSPFTIDVLTTVQGGAKVTWHSC